MIDRVVVPIFRLIQSFAGALALTVALAACGNVGQPTTRLGMVKNPETGLMFGSVVEKNLVTDASFYKNRKIKVRIRNTSGDVAFGLRKFTDEVRAAYASSGYELTEGEDFGLLVDVNVRYSGQIQTNLSKEFGFLGAAAGGIVGGRNHGPVGAAAGVVAGATLGTILGSFVTDDTYIIVADLTFGVIKETRDSRKTVTFSRSEKLKNMDDPNEDEKVTKRGFKEAHRTGVAVFAGGRNTTQAEIAGEVRHRIVRIVSEFI